VGEETRGGTSADAEASFFAEATEDGSEDGMAVRPPEADGEDAQCHGSSGMFDFWSLGNGFVLACLPGAELGKNPVFKGFSHWENGFVLSNRAKVTSDE
jgi:hypothetical protein